METQCPLCGSEEETSTHIMLTCTCTEELWSEFPGDLPDRQNIGITEWLQRVFNGNTDVTQRVGFFLAGIWFARNRKVWDGIAWDSNVIFNSTTRQVSSWKESRNRSQMEAQNQPPLAIVW